MPAAEKLAVVSTALSSAKVAVPGPLTWLQSVVTLPGGVGRPSSVTVASNVASSGRVIVWSAPASTTGAWLMGVVPYSTCNRGAAAGIPSYASAVRSPLPLTIITNELPLDQPGRSTISWMIGDKSGVRWSGPATPTVVQATGDQCTAAVVRGLDETFPTEEVKAGALTVSWPSMVRDVAPELASSTWNCTWAR